MEIVCVIGFIALMNLVFWIYSIRLQCKAYKEIEKFHEDYRREMDIRLNRAGKLFVKLIIGSRQTNRKIRRIENRIRKNGQGAA